MVLFFKSRQDRFGWFRWLSWEFGRFRWECFEVLDGLGGSFEDLDGLESFDGLEGGVMAGGRIWEGGRSVSGVYASFQCLSTDRQSEQSDALPHWIVSKEKK